MNYDHIARRALELYGLTGAEISLLGHSDKRVYLAVHGPDRFVLSLYIPSSERPAGEREQPYLRPEAILSEARLMELLAEKAPELGTQRILRSRSGALIESVGGVSVRLTDYVEGEMLDDKSKDYPMLARRCGEVCAQLHDFALQQGLAIYEGRPVHRQEYFRAILDDIEQAHTAGRITDAQFAAVQRGGKIILACMDALDAAGQIGFVHTDLRSANFLSDGTRVIPIDFSRGVLGYPLYDLGEMCMHMGDAPVQRQILGGYDSVRSLTEPDLHCIEAFAVMFILDVCAEFLATNNASWLEENLLRIERYFVPGLENGTLLPRDFR